MQGGGIKPQYIGSIMCHKDSLYAVDVRKAKEGGILTADVLELLENLLAEDEKVKQRLGELFTDKNSQIEVLTKDVTQAETHQKNKEELVKKQEEEKALTLETEQAQMSLQQAK